MKRVTFFAILIAVLAMGSVMASNVVKVERDFGPSFVGNDQTKCIVIFKENAVMDQTALENIARSFNVNSFKRQFPTARADAASPAVDRVLTRYYKAQFPAGNLDKVMAAYANLPFVEKVEPVGLYRMHLTPNDRYYDDPPPEFPYDQWHYWDTYGINADSAWDVETGDPDVIVAVIDGGVRYTHYELGGTNPPGPADNSTNGNIWVNDGETPNNGQDDDNNGYVDDVIGWDFVQSSSWCNDVDCSGADNDPDDYGGHGTHLSGTIAAITNNDATWGVAGVAGGWNDGTTNFTANGVKIMCLRAGWYSQVFGGLMAMDYVAEAMYYVATMVDKGYNVTAINCSFGSSSLLEAATNAVLARDVMVIVAAGNDNSSSCDYLGCRTDCLDVGATDKYGNPASFSQYGTWIEVAAPGVEILSTYANPSDPGGTYIALMDGTSMSCPHVVAVAGLLESFNPSLTGPEKFDIIADPANMKSYNMTKYVGAGIVDARRCLDAAGTCDLAADFMGSPTSGCAPLLVSFTDLSTGTGIDGWLWDFGDGVGTSTAQNPNYTYNNPGTYAVSLTVYSSSQGCDNSVTKPGYITIQGPPTADFVGSPTSGNAPLTVDFTDLSTGNPDTWSWDFGDGIGTSAEQNPSYTYNNDGVYTVTLTASNACGSDVEVKTGYITVIVSEFEYAYALSDIPVLGTVTNNFTYTHASDNSYEVITETLSDNHPRKRTSWAEHKWNFNVAATGAVTFYVEAYRPNNSDGDDFIFAYSTDDINYTDIVTVASATEQVYSASLPSGLNGTVYIRVMDSNRSWDLTSLDPVYIDQMYIEFESTPGPPVADFVGDPTYGPAPLLVSFTDLSTGNPDTWDWDFGDGVGTSADQNPTYTYNNTGSYTVTLFVSNAYGNDTEIKTGYITVTEIGNDMYVYSMVVGRTKSGPYYYGTCTVTIYDDQNNPVQGATVYVTATGPTGGNYNGVTAADGTVDFQTATGLKKPVGEWCFEVTDVTHATYTYNPALNNVTMACESGPVYKYSDAVIPTEFGIRNYPNPFNPATTLEMSLPVASEWQITIYNVVGQRIEEFSGHSEAGIISIQWDGTMHSSGIYFYKAVAGDYTATEKMVLMK